jgi:hypothetical protein
MGIIIAITISKPVEIRMFQTEINTALYKKQLEKEKDFEISTRKTFEDRLKDLGSENNEIQERVNDYIKKINIKDSLYNVETSSGQGNRIKGEGPVAIALKNERERLKEELILFTNSNKDKIDDIQKRRKEINEELTFALKQNKKVSSGLDGLVERIKLAHEVAGWTITIFIMLLFMAIELTPIFFKLMLTKSTYDYLAENRDELLKADYGIEVQYDKYKDKEGVERHLTINHEAERIIFEKKMVTNIQKELTKYAVTKYKEREMKKIDDNFKWGNFEKTIRRIKT